MTRLADLREPPIVGNYYLVPVVERYPWHGRIGDWPVLGPLHEDREFFNFTEAHYHIDIRFVSARQHKFIVERTPWTYRTTDDASDAALTVSGTPLQSRGSPLPYGRPILRRLRCKRESVPTSLLSYATVARDKMIAAYGNPALPICRRDGRKLCPHRKVDLSSFPPDAAGIVVCPLHGLRVQVA